LSPVLIGDGRPAADVAPAALASTFVTSVAGVATFTILSVHHPGSVAHTPHPPQPADSYQDDTPGRLRVTIQPSPASINRTIDNSG
jgi:hypothetical protein